MRIWCCFCFGEEEEDNNKGYKKSIRDLILGNNSEESPDETPAFDWRAVFDGVDVGGAGASRPRADNVGVRRNEEIDFDINWLLSDVEARNGNYSGERMLNVNLNLGLSEEASSPSIVLKEDPDCDSCSKRPKVNSFSL